MASNVIMAISNQTYLRVYPLIQDSVIPPVAILTGTTMFGPWNFGATIFGQNLSSCTISNTDWRLYPHWMGFYINGKIIEVKWTKWWFSSKPCLINRGYLCNPLPKSAPPLKPHRILLVTRKLETGQERSGNTMKHLHQMNELMGRFCTHSHTVPDCPDIVAEGQFFEKWGSTWDPFKARQSCDFPCFQVWTSEERRMGSRHFWVNVAT